jgi:LPXTG-site transpeptidase (sortase) family protein
LVSVSILKKPLRLSLVLVILIILSFILVNLIKTNFYSSPKVLIKKDQENIPFSPVRLVIPVINISANIQSLGVNSKGEMEVPNNITDVGLFKFGVVPGQIGSAVIAGHFNGENNQAGVFTNLDKLKVGDKLFVEDKTGKAITFIVQKKELYDSGYADNVFNQSDIAHLNLITCDGLWDKAKRSYTKRLVIFSDILKE